MWYVLVQAKNPPIAREERIIKNSYFQNKGKPLMATNELNILTA